MNISNSMIDQLAALDQAESHFRSENIKFGIRHRMRSGKTVLNHTQFLGYTKGPDGVLQIVPEEAEVVRKIFELYLQGNGVRKIKRYLEENEIKTVTGKTEWSTSTIDRMLSNEKYIGEVRMQKTFTADFLTGRREKNIGQLDSYLVENAHEPIIDRETFELVQKMKGKSRACLKIVIIPKRWLFFPHTLPIFLGIHQVFLRQIGFVWRKNPSPLGTFPIFKQRLDQQIQYIFMNTIIFMLANKHWHD